MHRLLAVSIVLMAILCTFVPAPGQAPKTSTAPVKPDQISPLLTNEPEAPPGPRVKPEDWTTLSLEKSNLPLSANGGPVLSKIEGDGYTRELIQLRWRAADPIDLYVVRPHGAKSPPVILYMYNFTSDAQRFRDDGWCKRMTKDGFAAVAFSSALSGDRLHSPRPMKQWFVSELQEALSTSTHDVEMVLSYLETRGDLDMKSVGIFGQGSGGAIAILAGASDARIKAVDVMDPWGDWPDWLKSSAQVPDEERAQYLKPEFLGKVANLDPVNLLPQLEGKALRVQQVLDDPVTGELAQNKIKAAVKKPDEVVRFEDLSAVQKAYSTISLSAWLRAQLRPPSL